ncbi:putative iron-regulated membrane protein [Hydrogenophaga palleronii]|uniref:Iron-regulated membrane protein n=1 Tax=Hydrogenophaga palleronii TaxID=65655 RepID=A0ABU1WI55_9BURK|nr:PepSY domain-containing protein [Hydrogenophaga palleronii]MDR7148960.1 putative iron-regulated membrane protein [Hydrogenophaga palleronii]
MTAAVSQNPEQLPSDEFFDTDGVPADGSRNAEAASQGKKKTSRTKLWFLVHSWAALPIWIFLFFVCLTGSIATVSQEIVWLADPAVRARPPSSDARVLGYDEILAAVNKARPDAIVRNIARPVKSQFALAVRVSYADGTSGIMHVNPYTGDIQGTQTGFDFRQFIRALHGWLLMPFNNGFNFGWYAVSLLGLPMLVSLVTGLVVYKKFWRGFFKPRLRVRQGARVFWGDFHRLAGIWSIPFVLIMAVTGLWFLTRALLSDFSISITTEGVPPVIARADVPITSDGLKPPLITLEQAAQRARDVMPELQPLSVRLPANAYDHIVVQGRGDYPLLFERLHINPYNGAVESVRRVSDRSALELVTESMRPLHTGDFAGLWLKLVYFFFGVLLTMMVFSGMLIWTKRTVQATASALKREHRDAREPTGAQHAAASTVTSMEGAQ